jgi:hypothetical protein
VEAKSKLSPGEKAVLVELRSLDCDELSPRRALELLIELRARLAPG